MGKRVCFIAEGMVDVRLIDGLSMRCNLTLVTRQAGDNQVTSQPTLANFTRVTGPPAHLSFGFFVWKFLLQHQGAFDSVIVQGYGISAFAANIALYQRRAALFLLVCTPSESYYRCRKLNPTKGKRYSIFGHLARYLLGVANGLFATNYVVLSKYLEKVVRSHGVTKATVEIVPVYGVNVSIFKPKEFTTEEVRSNAELPLTGKLLFMSSRVAPEKDFRTVLRAFKLIRAAAVDAWLLNTSGGYEEFMWEARILGVEDRIIAREAVHPLDGLAQLYQAADVCIQASLDEGLGFSPLEALACGVPVVASAVGGLTETIRDGETGWSVPPGDDEKLARAIMEVLDSPDEAERRARIGRADVLMRFESNAVLDKLLDLL